MMPSNPDWKLLAVAMSTMLWFGSCTNRFGADQDAGASPSRATTMTSSTPASVGTDASSSIPPIDRAVPETIETATFALG